MLISHVQKQKNTALFTASINSIIDVLNFLISHGVDAKARDEVGKIPLYSLVQSNFSEYLADEIPIQL